MAIKTYRDLPNLKKVIPMHVCFGFKPTPEEDECGICKHCHFIQACGEKTSLNKARLSKSQFRKTQEQLLNQRINEVFDSLKNL